MDNPTKAQELLATLISRGRSQGQIAREIGVAQPTVSRLLSGEIKDPRSSTMERLKAVALLSEGARQ